MSYAAKDLINILKSWVPLNSRKWRFYKSIISGNEPHIGISLGNTFTYVSIMEDNMPKLIKQAPSVNIYKLHDGAPLNLATYGVKQLLGIKFDDPLVQKEMKRDTFLKEIVRGPDGYAWFRSTIGELHQPVALLANVLRPMRMVAQSFFGKSVLKAVVALPPYYSESQVLAAFQVCGNVGMCVVQTIDEATAAGIAYEMHNEKKGTVFAVVNMGGRTFHVSILEVDCNGKFVLKGLPKSDVFLGGVEFDNVLVEFMCKELKRIEGKDLHDDSDLFKLRSNAQYFKTRLSYASAVSLPFQVPSILTRNEFERLVSNLIDKIKEHCVTCLKDAHIASQNVDEVLLVGGMAKMPIVQKAVTEVFGKSLRTGVDSDEAVALGASAAIQAGVLGDDWYFLVMSRN